MSVCLRRLLKWFDFRSRFAGPHKIDVEVAFSLTAENSHTHLQQVDPGAGSYADLKFPSAPAPDLMALLSVPTGAAHEARIFGQTTKGELVEITPSSCGPPTQ